MQFKDFRAAFDIHFKKDVAPYAPLFEAEVDKDEMWNLYLDSFPKDANPLYRKRREFDCSCCRHFVKTLGNVVAIKDNKIVTMWGFDMQGSIYQPVIEALDSYIKSRAINGLWLSSEKNIGTKQNFERDGVGNKITTWDHFYLEVPRVCVSNNRIPELKGKYRDMRSVFKRSLEELTDDSVDIVLELIAQNSLYRGMEWRDSLNKFRQFKVEYGKLPVNERENWLWHIVNGLSPTVAKIRNTSMGTFLINLSDGMNLDAVVHAYESVVAPSNYKRPKAIFTKKMLEDAQRTVQELGYMNSLGRRFATLDDITVNNILFSNKDAAARMAGASNPFEKMAGDVSINPRQFSRVEKIDAEKFFFDVLPMAQEVELFLENRHSANMVSLVAPLDKNAPSMFKWNNGFSWAYTGNVTDSHIRENVKFAGGKVDGVLRCSIQWNDGADYDRNDEDIHCIEPSGNEIFYGNKDNSMTGGSLDVDIIWPEYGKAAVENITWPTLSRMRDGKYKFFVHCFNCSGGRSGFRAEIEFNGQIYRFDYAHPLHQREDVQIAEITLKNGLFTIDGKLPSNVSNRDIWGLKSNQFSPVTVAMYSPNYWDEQSGIGNRHYFFMLKNCVNPEKPNGFYNEFVKAELLKHKRVFEALGGQMAVQDVDDQLSGVGFSSTKRNDVIVKVKGATERVLKIKF